jgi:Ca-activated chloride channel homolog
MTRLAPVLSGPRRLAGTALVLLLGAGAAAETPVFRSEGRLVVLHVTVRNARGELVTDLQQDGFSVYENGKPQVIAQFRRDDVPVSLGLLLDNSGSMRRLRSRMERAALACVRASNPQDEAFVLDFADKARVDVPFTSDPRVLEAGIARADSIGGTAMLDALDAGAAYLSRDGKRDRKVLLLITDGNDNASVTSMDAVRKEVEQHDVVIYAIGLLTEEGSSTARRAQHELGRLAELSGGVAYCETGPEDLEATALSIARQIRSQYTIGYVPSDQSLDGSYRKLRVVARGRERLSVQTRAGYRAVPSPSGGAEPVARRSQAGEGTPAAAARP